MQLRIDEVEKNAERMTAVAVPEVSESTKNQYRAVQLKLDQLQGTQNSMKDLYEKLFEQSKKRFENP